MSRHTKNEMSSHPHPTNRPALRFHNIFSIDPIPQTRRPCQVRNSKVLICMNSAVQEGKCHSPRAGRNCSIPAFKKSIDEPGDTIMYRYELNGKRLMLRQNLQSCHQSSNRKSSKRTTLQHHRHRRLPGQNENILSSRSTEKPRF